MFLFMCPICRSHRAQEIEVDHDGIGVDCADCGCYFEIAKDVGEKMASHGFTYDPGVARYWIMEETKSGRVPLITWEVAAKMVGIS